MKIYLIPIVLIIFLFQSCVSIIAIGYSGLAKADKIKECSIKEVFTQNLKKEPKKIVNFALFLSPFIDMGLISKYVLNVHQPALILLASGYYIMMSMGAWGVLIDDFFPINFIGWNHIHSSKCKEEYFIISFPNKFKRIQGETFFIKRLLNFPEDHEVSYNPLFVEFYPDMINNKKIKTYEDSGKYYLYFYYKGGKEKFEKDYEKYLYKK